MNNNDKELYEINIDKLCYSLENGNIISVEDYIDYRDEIYSIEKIFNKKFSESEYKEKEEGLMKVAGELYDIINNLANSLKKDLHQKLKTLNKENPDEILKNSFIFVKKEEFIKNIKAIASGQSKEKGTPIVILGDFSKYIDAISGKWYNPISWLFKGIQGKVDNIEERYFSMRNIANQSIRDKKSMRFNKDKQDRKNTKLFNVRVKREKGNILKKMLTLGTNTGGSHFTSRWRDDKAQTIFMVYPKFRIKN